MIALMLVAAALSAWPGPVSAASPGALTAGTIPDPAACTGGITGMVWYDANADGIRNPAEATNGINGVTLELRDGGGALLATRTTGSTSGSIPGVFGFAPICPGNYTVTIASGVPAGYVPTLSFQGADPTRFSWTSPAAVVLGPGSTGLGEKITVNFGFKSGCTGAIGDRVWHDINADGVQDPGETGLAGVSVRLRQGESVVDTVGTDADGHYLFRGLCGGNYAVDVTAPAGFAASPTGAGTPATDSDASGVAVSLGPNDTNVTIDFGFHVPCTGTIGDFVWHDLNRNGIQDAGEPGVDGVTLELLNGSGVVVQTAVTGSNGAYVFTGLCAGRYTVRVVASTLPATVVPTMISVPGSTAENDSNGSPASVTLPDNGSSETTLDFGYHTRCTGQIGDLVWYDLDADGVQDPGDPGIGNVAVTLRDQGTDAVVALDTTDANGYYLFAGLCAGTFVVEVNPSTLPAGMFASPAGQGGDDSLDSDGVGHRAAVALAAIDSTDLTIDFGYFLARPAIDIEKFTNGEDADVPPGPTVAVGSVVTWTYVVTNTGNVPLTNVSVTDDKVDASGIDCGAGTHVIGSLGVGAAVTCTASGLAVEGQYANIGTAAGMPPFGGSVSDSDPSHYFAAGVGDPRTPGYWKNWNRCTGGNQDANLSGYWLLEDVLAASSVTIGALRLYPTDCVTAVRVLDKTDVITGKKRANDPLFNLAAHLLAAHANVIARARTCDAATTAISSAQALLTSKGWNGTGNYRLTATEAGRARSYATTLDSYNNDLLCPF